MQWSNKNIQQFSCFFYNICHTLLLYYLLLSTLSCWNTSKIKPHRSAGPWEIFYASQRWQWWLFDIKLYCFRRFFQDLIWEWWLWVKRWVTAIRNGNNWICLENIELVFLLYLPLTTAGWQELIRHVPMKLFYCKGSLQCLYSGGLMLSILKWWTIWNSWIPWVEGSGGARHPLPLSCTNESLVTAQRVTLTIHVLQHIVDKRNN